MLYEVYSVWVWYLTCVISQEWVYNSSIPYTTKLSKETNQLCITLKASCQKSYRESRVNGNGGYCLLGIYNINHKRDDNHSQDIWKTKQETYLGSISANAKSRLGFLFPNIDIKIFSATTQMISFSHRDGPCCKRNFSSTVNYVASWKSGSTLFKFELRYIRMESHTHAPLYRDVALQVKRP